METEVGAIAVGQQILSGNDVLEAQFKLQGATENGEPAQKLYLKTFQPIDRDMQIGKGLPPFMINSRVVRKARLTVLQIRNTQLGADWQGAGNTVAVIDG